MLRIHDLTWHDRRLALLEVPAGECVSVTGPSGSGKSRLLRAIADLEPNEGRVEAFGVDREETPAPDWRRLVMYLAATSGWWADTVAPHFEAPEAAPALIEAVCLPADSPAWQVAHLSSGEKQRLALVRALLLSPRVLLLDEPTASLDSEAAAAVETVIQAQLGDGACALLVTHDAAQARRLASRTVALSAGDTRVMPL
jgi:ABC-type iron transport system FetAB ATPase subunit